MDAFFVRGNDVRFAVGVDVVYFELGPCAGVIVDFVRDELSPIGFSKSEQSKVA